MKKKFSFSKYKTTLVLIAVMMPAIIYVIVFHYVPLGGLIIAFKDYNSYQGLFGSPWASMNGFKHFYNFVHIPDFWKILFNTLALSTVSLFFGIVLPIAFALLINEIRNRHYKRAVQTISYAPYFISTVVVVGMLFDFTNAETGCINRLITFFGGKPKAFMEESGWFIALYVITGVWQGLGWSAIIYVGALSNVDLSLHEAAVLDGAGRWKRIIHVNLPTVLPIMTIMLIMNVGNLLNVGFEKVYLMQTAGNLSASRIITTYIYEVSLQSNIAQYSYATAIGIFNSAINVILLCASNVICKKLSETSLW